MTRTEQGLRESPMDVFLRYCFQQLFTTFHGACAVIAGVAMGVVSLAGMPSVLALAIGVGCSVFLHAYTVVMSTTGMRMPDSLRELIVIHVIGTTVIFTLTCILFGPFV